MKENIFKKSFSPLSLLLFIFFTLMIFFVNQQSTININNRNNTNYENNLKKNNYSYQDDLNYKKKLSEDSKTFSISDLDFIIGPQELEQYMQKFDADFHNYAYGIYNPPKDTYLSQKKLRANLNIHSLISDDGNINIKNILNEASDYADALASEYPNQKYIIAVADVNNISNCKYIIKTIKSNKEKYKNLKIVLGVEIPTTLEANNIIKQKSKVNILAFCINPFDKNFKKEISKTIFDNKEERDFDETIDFRNSQDYIIYGISKPLQNNSDSIKDNLRYLETLLTYYANRDSKPVKFVEAYYDPYIYFKTSESSFLLEAAEILNF